MRHPDDMKEKRKLNRNVICHDMRRLDRFTPRSNSRPRFAPRDLLLINSQRNFIYHSLYILRTTHRHTSAVSTQTSEVSSYFIARIVLLTYFVPAALSCASTGTYNTSQPFLPKRLSCAFLHFYKVKTTSKAAARAMPMD
jgi:hypothetical protein